MTPKKIITHPSQNHADETSAIALILSVFDENIPIERKSLVAHEEFEDPAIWIIDIGKQLNYTLHNFDHHQDENLPASNILVLNYMFENNLLSADLHEQLKNGFNWISSIDTYGYRDLKGFQVNSLINSINQIEGGFEFSIKIFKEYIKSRVETIQKSAESLEIWAERQLLGQHIAVCKAYPIRWKSYQDPAIVLITRSKRFENQWEVHSKDATIWPLVEYKKAPFMHNKRFMAAYNSFDDARICAELTVDAVNKYAKKDAEIVEI